MIQFILFLEKRKSKILRFLHHNYLWLSNESSNMSSILSSILYNFDKKKKPSYRVPTASLTKQIKGSYLWLIVYNTYYPNLFCFSIKSNVHDVSIQSPFVHTHTDFAGTLWWMTYNYRGGAIAVHCPPVRDQFILVFPIYR